MKRAAGFTRVMELVGGLGLEFGGTSEKKIKKQKTRKGVAELLTLVN